MPIYINPDLIKQIQTQLSQTAKTLINKSAIPVITIAIDSEHKVIIISEEQLRGDNLKEFLKVLVANLDNHKNETPIISINE